MEDPSSNIFKELNKRVLIKCGGFSTQLATHVGDKIDGDPLWSSRFDETNPNAVVKTHLDFLKNGAEIILTNTYQSSVQGFMEHLNLTKNESINLIRKSVQLAQEAKQTYLELVNENKTSSIENMIPLVLASIGPYGAHLHDGSEYKGSYADVISKTEIQSWHRTRIDACLAEGIDGLAIETIPCLMEADALLEMLLNDYSSVKFWISFQCKDNETLAHGEKFADAVEILWNKIKEHDATDRLIAIGVNCVDPNFVSDLLISVHNKLSNKDLPPFVVYSNRGEKYDDKLGCWTGFEDCIPLENYVEEWIKLGAKIIGGCCRVFPQDILKVKKTVDLICSKEDGNCEKE